MLSNSSRKDKIIYLKPYFKSISKQFLLCKDFLCRILLLQEKILVILIALEVVFL